MRDALASDPAGLRHQHPAFCFREKPGSGVFLALTGSLPCASNDRPPPARGRGELCSHPLHRGAWDESQDTPAPAGGPVCPCWRPRLSPDPIGTRERLAKLRACLFFLCRREREPRSLACISAAGGAGSQPAPAPGRGCSGCPARRCCQAAQVTAHTGRPRPPGSPTAGSTAQPGCPECPPCRSQHRLCGRKSALDCARGGSILPGEVITATAQLQGTSCWPSAHPKSFASASSGNFPRACLSRPRGSTLTSPQCPGVVTETAN